MKNLMLASMMLLSTAAFAKTRIVRYIVLGQAEVVVETNSSAQAECVYQAGLSAQSTIREAHALLESEQLSPDQHNQSIAEAAKSADAKLLNDCDLKSQEKRQSILDVITSHYIYKVVRN
jgi:hypothetical protein